MFLNPLGLLALLAVPAVVALHLFRRRFQPKRVSALFLWEARTTTALSGRRRDRVLRSPSFWAEVLLALLLALALAGPRACSGLAARHLVVVLDGSASMSARPQGADGRAEASFAERAVDEVDARIAALPGGSRVTLVLSGARPTILCGPAAFPQEARAALDGYPALASAGRHDLEPATSLALQLAGAGAVTVVTDRFEPERFPERVGVVALGRPLENLAITRATRLAESDAGPGAERVLLTVANLAERPRTAAVRLEAGDETLAAKTLELEPRGRGHLAFDVPAGTPTLSARLAPDALALDDEALLAPPPPRTLALASTLGEEVERRLGLGHPGAPRLARWLALVPRATLAATPEEAHLLLTDEPDGGPRTWDLVLHAPAGEPLDLVGPFLVETRHPLLEGVTLDGVVWSAGADVALPGVPLVSAGNLPLVTEELTATRRLYHLNVNLARSSLARSPDWPILLANLAELRRLELAGPVRVNLAMGESLRFRGDGEAEYELRRPSGSERLRARDELVVDDVREVGRYELARDGAVVAEYAVHFGDDAEGDLTRLDAGERTSSVELAEQRAGSSWVELWLGALALGALLFDWYVLRPRRTAEAKP